MRGAFEVPPELEPLQAWVFEGLERVVDRMESATGSDIPAVAELCRHVERYRGKMLRPTLTLLSGAAAGAPSDEPPSDDLVTAAAVVEMVHMATLVHDDILDEAAIRRGGQTVNTLRGNETAVILGDYLIAAAYALCSSVDDQAPARVVAAVSMELCSGELLQLDNRDNRSLDEATYFEILRGKTGSLVGACGRLGAGAAGGDEPTRLALETYGRRVGVAFQIQDDVLDLQGDQAVVGKTLGQDLGKGKLTLPLIHHLQHVTQRDREASLRLLDALSETGDSTPTDQDDASNGVLAVLDATGSIAAARREAERLVTEAKDALQNLPDSPART
ncbi:MAG: polyprenyl synthetase family protein, partial [Planctomycetota bacterium]